MTDPAVAVDLAPTGVLRASINLGNPVLAQGTSDEPAGVTVDLAREIAARLGVPVSFACFDAARKSLAALIAGAADVAFLAVEPAREAEVSFTAPYVIIEGVYAVPDGSPITTAAEVDRPGVRVGVNEGSAYDLFLSRTLTHAQVVRGADGIDVYADVVASASATSLKASAFVDSSVMELAMRSASVKSQAARSGSVSAIASPMWNSAAAFQYPTVMELAMRPASARKRVTRTALSWTALSWTGPRSASSGR